MREVSPIPMGETEKKTLLEITDPSIINKDFFDNIYRLCLIVAPNSNISFEMLWRRGVPHYFINVPDVLLDFLKNETWLRSVQFSEDYASYINPSDPVYSASEFTSKEAFLYPIEPKRDMSTLVDHFNTEDSLWFQILGIPASNSWQSNGKNQINLNTKKQKIDVQNEATIILKNVIKTLISLVTARPLPSFSEQSTPVNHEDLNEDEKTVLEAVERKVKEDGFDSKIRMVVVSNSENKSYELLQEVATRLSEVSGENGLNKLIKTPELTSPHGILYSYRKRYFPREEGDKQVILTTEELAKLFDWKPFAKEAVKEELVPSVSMPAEVLPEEKPFVPEIPTPQIPAIPSLLFETENQMQSEFLEQLPINKVETEQEEFKPSDYMEDKPQEDSKKEYLFQEFNSARSASTHKAEETRLFGEKNFQPGIHPENIAGEVVFL